MNKHCTARDCDRPVYAASKDECCIFHTETGKVREYQDEKPIFIDPEARSDTDKAVAGEFIDSFSALLEEKLEIYNSTAKRIQRNMKLPPGKPGPKDELNCDHFIFPALTQEEWKIMWKPLSEKDENGDNIIIFNFPVSFSDAHFGGDVSFHKAYFGAETDFYNSTFESVAFFCESKFTHMVLFFGADFLGSANFDATMFMGGANFSLATFSSEAIFDFCTYAMEANYIDIIFKGKSSFMWTNFNKSVDYDSAEFYREADFTGVQFNEEAYFKNSIFLERGTFSFASFRKEADFSNAIANCLDFTRCQIFSFLRLRELQKKSEISKTKAMIRDSPKREMEMIGKKTSPIILLRDLRFWENGHLLLEDMDASKVSFWQTNFILTRPRIDLIRVDWKDSIIFDDFWRRKEEKANYEKFTASKDKKNDSLGEEERNEKRYLEVLYETIDETENKSLEIERCYRQIRLAYEAKGEYPDAGDFYLREMDAKERRLKGLIRWIHWLYWAISNYGESARRATCWFIALLVLASICLSFQGLTFGEANIQVLNAMTLGKIEPNSPLSENAATILHVIRIPGLSVLALLLLAIRRRFKR